jgi:hypothetical protein
MWCFSAVLNSAMARLTSASSDACRALSIRPRILSSERFNSTFVAYEASLGTFGILPFILRAAAMDFAGDKR